MVIKRKELTWEYTLSFLVGNIFGTFLPSFLGDYLFFTREMTGIPLNPIEQIFYMLYSPSFAWIIFITLALLFRNHMKANIFACLLIAIQILSACFALWRLGYTLPNILMMALPQIMFVIILWTDIYPELYIQHLPKNKEKRQIS